MSSSRERLTVRPLDVRRPNLTAGGGRLKEEDCEFKVFLGGLEAITMVRVLLFRVVWFLQRETEPIFFDKNLI